MVVSVAKSLRMIWAMQMLAGTGSLVATMSADSRFLATGQPESGEVG